MSVRARVGIVVVVVGGIAFGLTRVIFPLPPNMPAPPSGLLPYFVFLDVVADLLFGLGIAFLVFGYPLMRRAGQTAGVTVGAYASIAFLLLNWWPHANLHMVTGLDFNKILWIDYAFHLPLFVSAAVVAFFFVRTVGQPRVSER